MAGTDVEEHSRGRWTLPVLVQETVAGLIVTLLVASIFGSLSLWRGFGILDLRLTELEKDYAALSAWKEEFGKKERFGKDDGLKVDRQMIRIGLKVDSLISTIGTHNQTAERYIERIDNDRARIKLVEDLMKDHLHRERERGTP